MERKMSRILQLLIAVACLIYIAGSAEQYRVAVYNDTETYLDCRNYYYSKKIYWSDENNEKDRIVAEEYSKRMCQDKWSWWNYEVLGKKFFSRF